MPNDRQREIYGHIEHLYAEPFAEAFASDAHFRDWVLSKTKFAKQGDTRVLKDEMLALRTSDSAPWWKNYFTPTCDCFGCAGGRETDIFAVLEDQNGDRFSLHVEVKQPTDRFNPKSSQGERYSARAACWTKSAPRTVPAHSDASTLILCSETKLDDFASEIERFDAVITFEEIARMFPSATPMQVSEPPTEEAASDFEVGQRVFHSKFGCGTIAAIEGNKLEIDFEHAGRKRVLDNFVSAD